VPNSRLIRVREAAEYLSVGKNAIRRFIAVGEFPAIQRKPGTNSPYLIDRNDLDKFISKHKRSSL
jgi:excisionase family DNA binding protein